MHLDMRFPTGVKFGAVGGPGFNTRMGRVRSGRTQRNAQWDFPVHRFQVQRIFKTNTLKNEFTKFFMVANGSLNTWRLQDPADNEVGSGEGVVYALGNSRFQLAKRYSVTTSTASSPNLTYTKDVYIRCPVDGTLVISGLTEDTHYTVDYSNGIVTTLGSPTVSFSSFTCEFDLKCRFEQDELMFQALDSGDDGVIFETQTITIIEER
jgi:uncharacterized protein (TIGR02217 family)